MGGMRRETAYARHASLLSNMGMSDLEKYDIAHWLEVREDIDEKSL